ncbi:MAG TPA: SMR family transporter [Casimicrobiaceae bacterium]|nr:SMR family transporter [Casimicrobiaceae bacterium]
MPAPDISLAVTLAVLGAGFLHALWNALLKSAAGDPVLDTALVVAGTTFLCVPLLLFVSPPSREAWPFVFASMAVHFVYYLLLGAAYRRGDLSFAYPLMRGVAPLIVTLLGVVFLHERLSAPMLGGIILISAGILTIAWFASGRHTVAAALYALANAAIIAIYTLIDGAGARIAGSAWSYAVWLTCLDGVPYLTWIVWQRGRPAVDYFWLRRRRAFLAGAASFGAYAIALWAMTRAPVAVVAALREVSVVFAALMGALFLKESFGWRRIAGAIGVAVGVAALRF